MKTVSLKLNLYHRSMRQSVIDRGHLEICFSLSKDKYIKVSFCSLNTKKKKLYPFLLTKYRRRV